MSPIKLLTIPLVILLALLSFEPVSAERNIWDDVKEMDVFQIRDGSFACPLPMVGERCSYSNWLFYFKCCGHLNGNCCFRFQVWLVWLFSFFVGCLATASICWCFSRRSQQQQQQQDEDGPLEHVNPEEVMDGGDVEGNHFQEVLEAQQQMLMMQPQQDEDGPLEHVNPEEVMDDGDVEGNPFQEVLEAQQQMLMMQPQQLTTILVMLSIGAAWDEPPGTNFIWITAILSIIVNCLSILVIGFQLEDAFFPHRSFINWSLVECIFSSLFAVNFFISIWLCVNNKAFSNSVTAYSLAATFCLAVFVQYTLNLIFHIRIWMAEQRKAMQVIDPQAMGHATYGAP